MYGLVDATTLTTGTMARTINFVSERHRQLTKTQLQDQRWLKWSVVACLVVVIGAIGVFSGQLYSTYQLTQLEARQKALSSTVISQDSTERSYLITLNKLKTLSQLLAARSNKQEALGFFTSLFGSDVIVRELNFQAEDQVMSFGLEAASVFSLEKVLELLGSADVKARFGTVATSELRRTDEATYTVMVTINLNPTEKKAPKAAPPVSNFSELEAE